jgi:hypothetical protein
LREEVFFIISDEGARVAIPDFHPVFLRADHKYLVDWLKNADDKDAPNFKSKDEKNI